MKKRKALNSAEAFPIVERYLQGNLLPHEVYKQEGWSDNQFYYWRKRYEKEYPMGVEPAVDSTQFHPITVTDTHSQQLNHAHEAVYIELAYPNGVTLRISQSMSDSRIIGLVKLY